MGTIKVTIRYSSPCKCPWPPRSRAVPDNVQGQPGNSPRQCRTPPQTSGSPFPCGINACFQVRQLVELQLQFLVGDGPRRKPYFPVHHRPLPAAKEDKDQTGQEGQAKGHEAAQAENSHHPRGTGPAPASLRTSQEQAPTPQGAIQGSGKGTPPASKGPGPLPDLPEPRHAGPDQVPGLHRETPAALDSGQGEGYPAEARGPGPAIALLRTSLVLQRRIANYVV